MWVNIHPSSQDLKLVLFNYMLIDVSTVLVTSI